VQFLLKAKANLFRFFVFFDRDNFAALIVATIGANGVRAPHFTTIRARNQVQRRQSVMRAAAVSAAARVFAFWLRGHDLSPDLVYNEQIKIPNICVGQAFLR
jgi:hypothetical protein